MIRRLRQKFVATNMALVSIVLLAVFAVLLAGTWQQQRAQTIAALYRCLEFEDSAPPKPEITRNNGAAPGTAPGGGVKHGALNSIACFRVEVDGDGAIVQSDVAQVDIDSATLDAVVAEALATATTEGKLDNPDLRFLCKTTATGSTLVFADRSGETAMLRSMALRLGGIGVAALLAFFGISVWLARMAVRPVAQAWQQQRQFVADASHELKTPLTVILTSASLLASHPEETVRSQQKWLDSIEAEGARMKQLINDLLFLAKNDATRAAQLPARVDWSDAVLSAALSFEAVAFEDGVTLNSEVAPGLCVQGDGGQLKQLAAILLDNACKYATGEKKVTAVLCEDKGAAVLTVSNTGADIPPADLPHLFERFYRTDHARTAGGFGLGLAIAKNICDTHSGSIRVQSSGGTTTFTVALPLAKAEKKGGR